MRVLRMHVTTWTNAREVITSHSLGVLTAWSETYVEPGSRGFFLALEISGRKKTRKALRLAGLVEIINT